MIIFDATYTMLQRQCFGTVIIKALLQAILNIDNLPENVS